MEVKDVLEYLKFVWEWLFGIQHWNTPEGWVARVVIWILSFYFSLWLLRQFLELILKIRDSWQGLGLPVSISPETKAELRQRQQFCGVLKSDLATIAKAESWNDTYFTDLEAEVETEGSYYASRFDRLIRRKSHGIRRVSSLINAIESSAEPALLLVGEPGSGKSVALRHLAHQLADKAMRSSDVTANIPLYINLKELPPSPVGGPTAGYRPLKRI